MTLTSDFNFWRLGIQCHRCSVLPSIGLLSLPPKICKKTCWGSVLGELSEFEEILSLQEHDISKDSSISFLFVLSAV